MTRSIIGVTGRQVRGRQVEGMSGAFDALDIDVHIAAYSRCIAAAGALPVQLPLGIHPAEIVASLDALVLTGGADIDPARYGEPPDAKLGPVEAERDAFEVALVRAAIDDDLPVLGICRGHQLINVALGGSLHQHISGHRGPPVKGGHNVTFAAGSGLGQLYGSSAVVNSLHHQAVDRVGEGLTATAHTTGDGVVEGTEHESGRILTVQWHPELIDPLEPVFGWLVHQCRR